MTRIVRTIATLTCAAAIIGVAAMTGTMARDAAPGALRSACKDDYRKLCAGVQSGGGRIVQCLRAHEKELTPACRDGLTTARR